MKRIVKFFSSIKLVIILLISLAFTSIIGTVIAQKQNPVLYVQHYGQGLYKLFKFMGFFDVYHSWWYILLLSLLSINIMFCALRRLSRDLRRPKSSPTILDDEMAQKFKLSHSKIFNSPLSECKDAVLSTLKKGMRGTPKQEQGENGGLFFFSEKNRRSWTFFHLTHISILIILFGGILSAAFGIKGYMQILEGEKADKFYEYVSQKAHSLGFTVKCDKFEIDYYPKTLRPKDYKSTLSVLDQGKETLKKVIEVNKPLKYKGMTIYQSSYGEDTSSGNLILQVKPKDANSKEPSQEFNVVASGSFEFNGADGVKRQVKVLRFLPDFAMDGQGKAFSKSNQLKNPAVQIMVAKEGESPFSLWCFQVYPDFHMIKKGEYIYTLKGYKGRMYTGLQVGKDPGIWVVWLGCILLMFGVVLVLYSSHQRIWVRLTTANQGCNLQIIGHADKDKLGFENKFNDLWQEMVDSLRH